MKVTIKIEGSFDDLKRIGTDISSGVFYEGEVGYVNVRKLMTSRFSIEAGGDFGQTLVVEGWVKEPEQIETWFDDGIPF